MNPQNKPISRTQRPTVQELKVDATFHEEMVRVLKFKK